MSTPAPGSGRSWRAVVTCLPRPSSARTAPVRCRSLPSRRLMRVDLPTPELPTSTPVRPGGRRPRTSSTPCPSSAAVTSTSAPGAAAVASRTQPGRSGQRSALLSTTTGVAPPSHARVASRSMRRGLKSPSRPVTMSTRSTLAASTWASLDRPAALRCSAERLSSEVPDERRVLSGVEQHPVAHRHGAGVATGQPRRDEGGELAGVAEHRRLAAVPERHASGRQGVVFRSELTLKEIAPSERGKLHGRVSAVASPQVGAQPDPTGIIEGMWGQGSESGPEGDDDTIRHTRSRDPSGPHADCTASAGRGVQRTGGRPQRHPDARPGCRISAMSKATVCPHVAVATRSGLLVGVPLARSAVAVAGRRAHPARAGRHREARHDRDGPGVGARGGAQDQPASCWTCLLLRCRSRVVRHSPSRCRTGRRRCTSTSWPRDTSERDSC